MATLSLPPFVLSAVEALVRQGAFDCAQAERMSGDGAPTAEVRA
jgi:hypothetical protein